MAVHGGPDVVTDGLVFCLDVVDKNCYPGSGTSATDLAQGIPLTLSQASVGTASGSFDSFYFRGTNSATADGVAFSTDPFTNTGGPIRTGAATIGVFLASDAPSIAHNRHIIKFGKGSPEQSITFNQWSGNSGCSLGIGSNVGTYAYPVVVSPENYPWSRFRYMVGMRRDNGDMTAYYDDSSGNMVEIGTSSLNKDSEAAGYGANTCDITEEFDAFTLGYTGTSSASGGERYHGHLQVIHVYRKELSVLEMQQNFDHIMKSRVIKYPSPTYGA